MADAGIWKNLSHQAERTACALVANGFAFGEYGRSCDAMCIAFIDRSTSKLDFLKATPLSFRDTQGSANSGLRLSGTQTPFILIRLCLRLLSAYFPMYN
jgi:hypothetical protein